MAKKKSQIKLSKNKNVILGMLVGVVIGLVAAWLLGVSSAAPSKGGTGSGKGGGGAGSSLSVAMVTDVNGDGLPNYGDTITFNISTSYQLPSVQLKCYQNNTLVYSANAGFYDAYPWPFARNMGLSSSTWMGGGANCTADLLGSTTKKPLATLNFTVNP